MLPDSIRWGFTFLLTSSRLNAEEREDLLYQATEMYVLKEKERPVVGENFEGLIFTEGKYSVISSGASGQQFDAELDTNDGKVHLRFLVSERTDGMGTAYSRN